MIEATPTLCPVDPFYPVEDAEMIHHAMRFNGIDEDILLHILCRRSSFQRCQIAQTYHAMYGVELERKIRSELSYHFEHVMASLVMPIPDFLAHEFHRAFNGNGNRNNTLIGILCGISNEEINDTKTSYQKMYSACLEDDIRANDCTYFENMCVALAQGQRDESDEVNIDLVNLDARRLCHDGFRGMNIDAFIEVFSLRSYSHLCALASEFSLITGQDLDDVINREVTSHFQKLLLALLEYSRNKTAYYAHCFHRALTSFTTHDHTLVRLIITRCEVDLGTIKAAYQLLYGQGLTEAISNATSGHYKKALLYMAESP